MRRILLVFCSLLLLTWFGLAVYPGHSYLAGASQLYLPVLQRLQSPGYLLRDTIATHGNVSFTVYDEATFFLKGFSKLSFRETLLLQQSLFRFAGVLGLFLLARSAGLRDVGALVTAALLSCGGFLRGPGLSLIDPEPVPSAFATGLVLLASGCFAREWPLLAGLFGGLALLYDPIMAAPFWIAALLAFTFDKRLRQVVRPMLPILVIFVLLLANLSQLQPATAAPPVLITKLPREIRAIELFRNPQGWVSHWSSGYLHLYAAIIVAGIWAAARNWPAMNRRLRWLVALLPTLGLLAVFLSWTLLDVSGFALALRIEPAKALVPGILMAWFGCALAALRATAGRRRSEAIAWGSVCLAVLAIGLQLPGPQRADKAVAELAAWAEDNTWGSSLFLFPDAGRELYPGVFRAESRRGLWVDWEGGAQLKVYPELASEWAARWRESMTGPLTDQKLQTVLPLPVDYIVLRHKSVVAVNRNGEKTYIAPAFRNSEFLVYDTTVLRTVPGRLHITAAL